ncbi:NADPH:quinone oxidoreductase family protein [Nocardioides endophyticus]|uniref:NADPH:quinone oxidoreductase family protein n=1 Tax=Nocardioides endophyticus TaxID=1353775 RepID=A0ABP8YHG8_9ACTN
MRAAVLSEFGLPARIGILEAAVPEPSVGDVAVQVEYTALSFPDLMVIEGTYQSLPELPFVPGTEFVGVVVSVGEGASRFDIGTRVAGRLTSGAFQEVLVIHEDRIAAVPDGVDPRDAVSMPISALTAHHALHHRAHVTSDDVVLITGANGIVGTAAVQIAADLGCRVIASVRRPEAVHDAVGKFADHVVSADPDELRTVVRELTGGKGVDVVIEAVGSPVFDAALRSLAWQGRLVVVGFAGGSIPSPKAGLLLVKNVSVSGIQITDYWARRTEQARTGLVALFDAAARGRMAMWPADVFAADQVAEAIDAVRERRAHRAVLDWTRTDGRRAR